MFFADQRLVAPMLADQRQLDRFYKVLSRESTLMAKLCLTPDCDTDQLVHYWGRGGRAKDVRPLIESLIENGSSTTIDIVHLLPRFARSRLYTYPLPPDSDVAAERDCHWSALNFFNEIPDDRFADLSVVIETIRSDYYQIHGDLLLGDLVLYFDGDMFMHSAVHVADGILFTKNGARVTTPWMLMREADMKDYYPALGGSEVRYYRKKGL